MRQKLCLNSLHFLIVPIRSRDRVCNFLSAPHRNQVNTPNTETNSSADLWFAT